MRIKQKLLHDELHWLDVPERVTFNLGLMTYRCLHGQAPRYLADHVTPAIEVASRHRLRSANRHRLIVPRCRLNTYGRRAFAVAGPTVWTHCQMNSEIRRVMLTASNRSLKQSCSAFTCVTSALEVNFNVMRSINLPFTYLLTYLYQLRGSDITGWSCKQTVGQSQLGILGSWAIFSSRIERVLLAQ